MCKENGCGCADDACGGKKYDDGKLRWDLLPMDCVEDVVKILTFGSVKYGANNWQNLEQFEDRYYAALMRHLVEWRKGNKIDEESGLSHLSHAMCNLVFLCWNEKHTKEIEISFGKTIKTNEDLIKRAKEKF